MPGHRVFSTVEPAVGADGVPRLALRGRVAGGGDARAGLDVAGRRPREPLGPPIRWFWTTSPSPLPQEKLIAAAPEGV